MNPSELFAILSLYLFKQYPRSISNVKLKFIVTNSSFANTSSIMHHQAITQKLEFGRKSIKISICLWERATLPGHWKFVHCVAEGTARPFRSSQTIALHAIIPLSDITTSFGIQDSFLRTRNTNFRIFNDGLVLVCSHFMFVNHFIYELSLILRFTVAFSCNLDRQIKLFLAELNYPFSVYKNKKKNSKKTN